MGKYKNMTQPVDGMEYLTVFSEEPLLLGSIFAFRRKHNLQTAWHVFCIPPPHHPLPSGKLQTASLEAEAEIIPRDSPLWINANILQYFHWKQFTRHLIIGHFAFCFKVWDSSGDHIPITSQCCAGTMERYESRPPSCSAESLSSSSIDLEDHYRGGYSTSKAWPWKDKNIHWLVDDFPTNTSIYQKKIRHVSLPSLLYQY